MRRVDEFVNADVIAKEEGVSEIEAGRRTLERLDRLAAERRDMAFETTLSSRTLLPRIKSMQAAGYLCHLTFCWLPSADMAVMRVARRVAAGGHSIPEDVIRRRYERGLENLFRDYLGSVDSWQLVNNTEPEPVLIAKRSLAGPLAVEDERIWNRLAAAYMKPRAEQQMVQAEKPQELPWTAEDILDAIREGVRDALRRHKSRGESIVVWRDGKIVTLGPDEIDV